MREERPEVDAFDRWASAVERVARDAAARWAEGSPRQGRRLLATGEHLDAFYGRLAYLVKRFQALAAKHVRRDKEVA